MLARQVILNCGEAHGLGAGCDGGEGFDVFEYMHRYGLPDESCANYVAESSAACDAQAVCSNCMPLGEDVTVYRCWPVPSPILYYVHSYGSVHGEAAMMSEIIARGPITCGFASIDDFDYGYRGGVYVDTSNATEMNHDVEVVGWGETEDGLRYWRARNSWGSYWGENSFFSIARGINNMQFESDCIFALFDVHHLMDVLRGRLGGSMFGVVEQRDALLNMSRTQPHVHDTRERKTHHSHHSRHSSHSEQEEVGEEAEGSRSRQAMADAEDDSAQSTRPDAWRLHEARPAQGAEELPRALSGQRPQPLQAGGRAGSSGQEEVDDNTRDRESRQPPSRELEGAKRSQRQFAQLRAGGLHESEHAARDDLYVEKAKSSEQEQQAERRIMQAMRAAYQHERARERAAQSSASQQQEQRERQQDEANIAAAIHAALHSINHDVVRAMVVRCLHQLESESQQQATVAGVSDSEAEARRQRDVNVVEDEVGRMWRRESGNATADEIEGAVSSIVHKVEEGGKKLLKGIERAEEEMSDQADRQQAARSGAEAELQLPAAAVDNSGWLVRPVSAVLLSLTLLVLCSGALYVLVKRKQRDEYEQF